VTKSVGDTSLHRALRPDFVPREYLGHARELRNRVLVADAEIVPAMLATAEPLLVRLIRHPILRREQVAGAIRDWRARMPEHFRIGSISVSRDRKLFSISERRISAHALRLKGWDDYEPGLSVIQSGFCIFDGELKTIQTTPGLASLHAVARRYERGDRSDESVLADLARTTDPDEAERSGWLGRMSALPSGGEAFSARSWWPPSD
jgi:hypothetical protein